MLRLVINATFPKTKGTGWAHAAGDLILQEPGVRGTITIQEAGEEPPQAPSGAPLPPPPPPTLPPQEKRPRRNPTKDPRAVWTKNRAGQRVLDIPATLKNLGLTEDQLFAQSWPRRSLECRVKYAIIFTKVRRSKQSIGPATTEQVLGIVS